MHRFSRLLLFLAVLLDSTVSGLAQRSQSGLADSHHGPRCPHRPNGPLGTCEENEGGDLAPNYIFKCGHNYPFNTSSVQYANTFTGCYGACELVPQCEGFVYYRNTKQCYLKDFVPNNGDGSLVDKDADYGAKFDTCLQLNNDGFYKDYEVQCANAWEPYGESQGRQPDGTFADCAAQCDAKPGCRVFNWSFYTMTCYLKFDDEGGPAEPQQPPGFERFYDHGHKTQC